MAPNGEIISGHGYDYDTGFFKRIPDELVPDLPEQIEQEDAAQALKWIIDNVCADFPFASDSDLAGFLSLLLTAIQRRLISGDEGCPGGGISAPVQASGKTALTQVLFNLVLGRSAAATAWVHDDVEMAKHLLAVLLEGQVYKYALEYAIEGVKADPTRDVPYLPSDNPDGFHAWTTDEVVQFEQTHLIGTKARLALALMLYAGCARRSDVVTLGRQHLTNSGRLQYRQFKGRNKKPVHIDIPLIAELRQVIDSSPCGELTFLVTEFGKPFTSNGFGNWFKKRCREAGLPHCSAHGVRKAAAARLAEVGSSDLEIMAIGGWQTLKEVQRYTKGARKKVLADHGMDKVQTDIDRTKVSNLSRDGT
ncbi:MAG: tyrosine-type recombinase/integrase [Rhodospirillaceae bacterium]|nr:tyrosine-type recombinase/integrase [Rhodospirillaceae bacterium]